MKFKLLDPPRVFQVGERKISVKDCAHIELKPDEQVTFLTETGAEYDVARKEWGFYATPSLNGRLKKFNLRAVLVKNEPSKKFYVFLVESGKEAEFQRYLDSENHGVVCWLDREEALEHLESKMRGSA